MTKSKNTAIEVKLNGLEKSVKDYTHLKNLNPETSEGQFGVYSYANGAGYDLDSNSTIGNFKTAYGAALNANESMGIDYIHNNIRDLKIKDNTLIGLLSEGLPNSPFAKKSKNENVIGVRNSIAALKMIQENGQDYIASYQKDKGSNENVNLEFLKYMIESDPQGFLNVQMNNKSIAFQSALGKYGAGKLLGDMTDSYKVNQEDYNNANNTVKNFEDTPAPKITEKLIKERDAAHQVIANAKMYQGIGKTIFYDYQSDYAQKQKEAAEAQAS